MLYLSVCVDSFCLCAHGCILLHRCCIHGPRGLRGPSGGCCGPTYSPSHFRLFSRPFYRQWNRTLARTPLCTSPAWIFALQSTCTDHSPTPECKNCCYLRECLSSGTLFHHWCPHERGLPFPECKDCQVTSPHTNSHLCPDTTKVWRPSGTESSAALPVLVWFYVRTSL